MRSSREADFHDWVQHHRIRLHKTAFLLCGEWHLADDLVQEALVKCFPRWERITAAGDPYPYLRRTLVRLRTDHSRRPSRREVAAEITDSSTTDTGPDFSHLLDALAALPSGQRTVLVLRYWEGLSVEETAEAIRTSAGNVKSQSSRGMQALRTALATSPATKDES